MYAIALALMVQHAEPLLPPAWHGAWAGECKLVTGDKEQPFPMELHFAPLDGGKFQFKIVYGAGDKKQVRDYRLVPIKDKPSEFVNDEQNGIETDVRLLAGVMHSAFDVTGVLIHSRFELRGDSIFVEMTSFDTKKPRETKLTGNAEFQVKSYRLQTVQRGELKKAKN